MKEIIIINGTGGSGKDTFVQYVNYYAQVYNFSSVAKVKEIAQIIGWDGISKTEKDRKFLSDLKKLTTVYNDMSFKEIEKNITEFKNNLKANIMFIHIREIEEIQRLVDLYPEIKTLLVKRVGQENIMSNVSDANVDNYNYDYIIYNDTLTNLNEQALNFVNDLENKYLKIYK